MQVFPMSSVLEKVGDYSLDKSMYSSYALESKNIRSGRYRSDRVDIVIVDVDT